MIHVYVLAFLIAFGATWFIHPMLVKLAQSKDIVDNPDARKLQRLPVPILGGMAVFFGLIGAIGCMAPYMQDEPMALLLMVLSGMLYIGSIDDVMGLTPKTRFVAQIACVLLLVFIGDMGVTDFHGLWGITDISIWLMVPLTVFICVGIINAINLVDGVDGLSSGYCVMASAVFGTYFCLAENIPMSLIAVACMGALIPFFLHNVFGRTSKMFIGDGGTLLMGMVMSIFVMYTLMATPAAMQQAAEGVGLIPFTMAVLLIPVFDTVRVMTARIFRGHSPFRPDKTHLHHLFIEVGFSHAGTTFCILTLNALAIAVWYATYALGGCIDLQLYVVLVMGFLFTSGVYVGVKKLDKQGGMYRTLRKLALLSHVERQGVFKWLQKVVDKV